MIRARRILALCNERFITHYSIWRAIDAAVFAGIEARYYYRVTCVDIHGNESDESNGVYLYRVTAANETTKRKMVIPR